MKSFLVHIASLAVMVHMTFGCSWHHGLGSAHACTSQNILTCCPSDLSKPAGRDDHDDDGHEHSDHSHHSEVPLTTTFDGDDSHPIHNHLDCLDDGCNATKVVKFVFAQLNVSTPYLSGAEDLAIANSASCSGSAIDPFPDCARTALKVRSHLLFGVQLI